MDGRPASERDAASSAGGGAPAGAWREPPPAPPSEDEDEAWDSAGAPPAALERALFGPRLPPELPAAALGLGAAAPELSEAPRPGPPPALAPGAPGAAAGAAAAAGCHFRAGQRGVLALDGAWLLAPSAAGAVCARRLGPGAALGAPEELAELALPEPLLELRCRDGFRALRSARHVALADGARCLFRAALPEPASGLCLSPHVGGDFATVHRTGIRLWDGAWPAPPSAAEQAPRLAEVDRSVEAATWWRHPKQLVVAAAGALFLQDSREGPSVLLPRHAPTMGLPVYQRVMALERHPRHQHQVVATATGPAQVLVFDMRRFESPLLRWPLPDADVDLRYRHRPLTAALGYHSLVLHAPSREPSESLLATACLGGRSAAVLAWRQAEATRGGGLQLLEGPTVQTRRLKVGPRPGALLRTAESDGLLLGCALLEAPAPEGCGPEGPGAGAGAGALLLTLTERGGLASHRLQAEDSDAREARRGRGASGGARPPAPAAGAPSGALVAREEAASRAGGGSRVVRDGPGPAVETGAPDVVRAARWLRQAGGQVAAVLEALGLCESLDAVVEPRACDVLRAQRTAWNDMWRRMPDALRQLPAPPQQPRPWLGPFAEVAAREDLEEEAEASQAGVLPTLSEAASSASALVPLEEDPAQAQEELVLGAWLPELEKAAEARAGGETPEEARRRLLRGGALGPLPAEGWAEARARRLALALALLRVELPGGWRAAPEGRGRRAGVCELAAAAAAAGGDPDPAAALPGARLLCRALARLGLLRCASAWPRGAGGKAAPGGPAGAAPVPGPGAAPPPPPPLLARGLEAYAPARPPEPAAGAGAPRPAAPGGDGRWKLAELRGRWEAAARAPEPEAQAAAPAPLPAPAPGAAAAEGAKRRRRAGF